MSDSFERNARSRDPYRFSRERMRNSRARNTTPFLPSDVTRACINYAKGELIFPSKTRPIFRSHDLHHNRAFPNHTIHRAVFGTCFSVLAMSFSSFVRSTIVLVSVRSSQRTRGVVIAIPCVLFNRVYGNKSICSASVINLRKLAKKKNLKKKRTRFFSQSIK